MGAGDTDGVRATFIGSDGNLFVGDLAGHNRHLVYSVEKPRIPNRPGFWVNRDFSMVALAVPATANRSSLLAVLKIDGGYRELIRDDQGRLFGSALNNVDMNWSWDNLYLAITTTPLKEGGRLIVVDVSNGSYRQLVLSDSDPLSSVRFSPDGRFIAYGAKPNSGTKRVYVAPVQGGEPHLAKEVPQLETGEFFVLRDWTADGRYLITKEVRQGKSALYLLPMKDGVPAGPSEFVRLEILMMPIRLCREHSYIKIELRHQPMLTHILLQSIQTGRSVAGEVSSYGEV
jgi:dipeptidyl aminopeptidase/acylaminoacyl peptidase